jgi:hypothetical protein
MSRKLSQTERQNIQELEKAAQLALSATENPVP